jgi:proteic killer suppression protein
LDISFKNTKLEKEFNLGKHLEKVHGSLRARKIRIRLKELRAASSLYDFWPPKSGPGRCHELTQGKHQVRLSIDLDQPYRLVFIPNHNPYPSKPDGGLDWKKVTAIKIIGVENTHE